MKIHLVHGAWHGSWCWDRLIGPLEAEGHEVDARDLPGLGEDRTPAAEVTLDRYVDAVCEALTRESEPVLLVGHSMGGLVISECAERLPEKVKALVYVSAYILRDAETVLRLAEVDENLADLATHLVSDGTVCAFPPEKLREIFYAKCTDSDAEYAISMLRPQPLAPFGTPVHVTPERFGRIPKYYIRCLQDRAVPPSLQEKMLAATRCEQVVSIKTDHSPFLSAPDELVHHLLSFCAANAD